MVVFVEVDEGDARRENGVAFVFRAVEDVDLVGNAGVALFGLLAVDDENIAFFNRVAEGGFFHADGDEAAVWVLESGGNPTGFVDPRQKSAAEEVAVLVQVSGEDEAVGDHGGGRK